MKPIIIDFPHTLDPAEVRRRMASGVERLPDQLPGQVAEVKSGWPSEDQMQVDVRAMGQEVLTTLDVAPGNVRVTVMLPPMLQLLAGPIEAIVRRSGEKLLLENPKT